ncbi:hypothetical protein B0189_05010 [Moraxella cuniculi]|nr:hypothetical protein B0189_05010 [Moraxella cuniculi]
MGLLQAVKIGIICPILAVCIGKSSIWFYKLPIQSKTGRLMGCLPKVAAPICHKLGLITA